MLLDLKTEQLNLGELKKGAVVPTKPCYYEFTAPVFGLYNISANPVKTIAPSLLQPMIYYTFDIEGNFDYSDGNDIFIATNQKIYIKILGYYNSTGDFTISINKGVSISPNAYTGTLELFTTPSTEFTWQMDYGDYTSATTKLVFYNSRFEEICTTSVTSIRNYTLSLSDLYNIMSNATGNFLYYSVRAYNNGVAIAQSSLMDVSKFSRSYRDLQLSVNQGNLKSGEVHYFKLYANKSATYKISFSSNKVAPIFYAIIDDDVSYITEHSFEKFIPEGKALYFNLAGYMNSSGDYEILVTRNGIIDGPDNKPLLGINKLVTPADYNFKEQYYYDEQSANVAVDNLSFETKRLRTGYISKEYIVMSPRRADAGVAYLEYKFTTKIEKINVDLALWTGSELLRSSDCTAVIQYKDANGNWITILDLLNDISLPTNRTNPINYTIIFPGNTMEFRFYSTSPAIGASNNTGRLCIGDMKIYY